MTIIEPAIIVGLRAATRSASREARSTSWLNSSRLLANLWLVLLSFELVAGTQLWSARTTTSNEKQENSNSKQESSNRSQAIEVSQQFQELNFSDLLWPSLVSVRERRHSTDGKRKATDKQAANKRQVIHAVLRGQLELLCLLEPPQADDAVSLVLWYKDQSSVPIYSIDARSSPVQDARHKAGHWLEGRASVRIFTRNSRQMNSKGDSEQQVNSQLYSQLGEENKSRQLLLAQLSIDALSSEDNGLYSCRVDFRKSRSRTQETLVKIIVPAEQPQIRDLSGVESRLGKHNTYLLGPHNEGAKLLLECQTQGGQPEPSLSWWRDEQLIDDSYEVVSADSGSVLEQHLGKLLDDDQQDPQQEEDPTSSSEQTATTTKLANQNRLIRNRLELVGLTRAHLMANYSCQAQNTKLAAPSSSHAMIDMNLRPIKVQIDGERSPVQAERALDVVCRAFGSRPAASLSWWKGQTRLVASADQIEPRNSQWIQIRESVSLDANITTSQLSMMPQISDAGQLLTCRAENARMVRDDPSAAIEDSWKLEIHYLPRVKLELGDKFRGHIQEGHDVYFECSVKANPAAHEIRWWFAGKELETNLSSGVIISNQSLVLQHVSRLQRGRYTCSAINQVGESHSNSLQLRVQHAPVCRDSPSEDVKQHNFKSHYGAARLESVKVFCHVDADPVESISYKWAFLSSSEQKSESRDWPEQSAVQLLDASLVSSLAPDNPQVGVLSFTPRSELDYGTLLCWAQNSLGQQLKPCVYQLVPAERPEPVRNCRLLNATESQLSVACEPGYDGGVDQTFQMQVFDTRTHQLVANVTSRLEPAKSSTSDYLEDAAEPSSSQPASLISEPQNGAHQQRQRHSQQVAAGNASGLSSQLGRQLSSRETVLMTEPNLRANTDYFLSIYSLNSKGSSKPVAFTATTSNLSESVAIVGNQLRADSSHLLSEVLALSWNPFLLVCAITVALFITFASITFALMKYVDFSETFQPSSARGSFVACLSSQSGHNSKANSSSQRDSSCDGSSSNFNEPTTNKTQRARVITLAAANNNSIGDKGHHIVLDASRDRDKSSLLDGSYLRLKLHQLTGGNSGGSLRQSNSDNYLNQWTAQLDWTNQQQQQQHNSGFSCGTLPKNLQYRQMHNQQQQQQILCEPQDNPYGQMSAMCASSSPEGGTSATTFSATSSSLQPLMVQPARNQTASQAQSQPVVEAAQVERLLISGKQYFHQPANSNLYQQLGGQQHLQLTSCSAYTNSNGLPRSGQDATSSSNINYQLCSLDSNRKQLKSSAGASCMIAGLRSSAQQNQVIDGVFHNHHNNNQPQRRSVDMVGCEKEAKFAVTRKQLLTGENYYTTTSGEQQTLLNNNPNAGKIVGKSLAGCDGVAICQLARVVLTDGANEASNVDSDAPSSTTQQTLNSLGSPSSGGLGDFQTNHEHLCTSLQCPHLRATDGAASSNSTLTSCNTTDNFESGCVGGNVISVAHHPTINSDDLYLTQPNLCASNGFKSARKNQTDPDQFTMYVDESCLNLDTCGNPTRFYVLPAIEHGCDSNKTTLRVLAYDQSSPDMQTDV